MIGRIFIMIAALGMVGPVFAQSAVPPAKYAYRQLPDGEQEEAARALMETLRCLVCQGQSIADSDADMAGDMRNVVRQRIAAGEDPEAVRDWLIERYGSWVSYDPPISPATWPLWLAPILLLGIGGVVAARKLQRRGDREDSV